MKHQKISCPNCKNDIVFDIHSLLQGKSFVCVECHAKIQLAEESKELVSNSIMEFDKLKNNVLKN